MTKRELFIREMNKIVKSITENYKPEKIVLFGSLARGDYRSARDMDLLIVKRTNKNPWQRLYEVDRYLEHKVPIDILVYTPEEIRRRIKMNDFFIRDITKKERFYMPSKFKRVALEWLKKADNDLGFAESSFAAFDKFYSQMCILCHGASRNL